MPVRITDLVDPDEIQKLKDLDTEFTKLKNHFVEVAQELAKGLTVEIKTAGDIDKMEELLSKKGKEAVETQKQMNDVMQRQRQVIANTTNTASRHLMEQERVNKATRAAYTEHDKVKKLLEHFHDTYENQLQSLVKINHQLEENKKKQKDNEKALKLDQMSAAQYAKAQADLLASTRELTQQKRRLNSILTAEEKANLATETSYERMSQQLELLKKAYEGLSEEGTKSPFGQELESAIQNLDARLKDVAADMGEFQRSVGNYAIAGQNGVVSTDSLAEAMAREARTTQDLIDQTKILEEAKAMLDKNDSNHQSTLDKLNAKIDENKRKLADVSDILGKEAKTVAEAEAQNKRLAEAIRHIDLSSVDAKEKLEEFRDQIDRNNQTIAQATGENEKFADSMLGLLGINANFGSSLKGLDSKGDFLDGLTTKTKAFGKTLMGLLSNPWVLAFLGIAGVVAGVKWWYDYNKGLMEATKLTKDFTGLTGSELKGVRNEVQAVADSYDKDFREVLEATNALSKQFGISFQEAMKLVEDGFVAGADANGEFLENVKEYPAYFREAGLSASEFIAITTQANQAGIYSDKGIDVIKEGNLRIREMTKATAEALDGIGISSKEVQQSLADGSKTTFDIMQEVSAKLAEFPESSSEVGTALADIFGGPGEDAGLQYILMLKDMDTNLDNVKDRSGELAKLQEEQLRSQVELENVIASVFDATGGTFESMTTKAKTFVNDGIIAIIKGCVDIVNWFIKMYNQSIAVRGAVNRIVNSFKTMWEVAKFILKQIVDSFKAMGTVIEGVVTMKWDKVMEGWSAGMNALKGNVETMARNIAANTADAFNRTMKDEIKEVTLDVGFRDTSSTPEESDEEKKAREEAVKEALKKAQEKAAKDAAKDAEKAAKDALKQLQDLEESKIALLKDGHEKDMATIQLNFKKKLDAIEGNSAQEQESRINLLVQMQQALEECELKYQQNLASVNLANRLASVREGSKEELDLKLAQIEASRTKELAEAEKSGADINLINEKFMKQRLELEEEYADKQLEVVQKKYADQEDESSTAMIIELNNLKAQYVKKLSAAKGDADAQIRLKEQFEQESADIEEKYAVQTAKNAVALIEEQLRTENLSVEKREDLERQLARAKAQLEQQMTDNTIANIELVNETDTKSKELRIKNAQQWLQAASDSLNAINELVGAVYDAKIQKIEEEQEANSEAGEAEQNRIQELVDKKIITEEEGEARKRAAEAQTARKEEELEKKKAALKERQARFDKLNSIAQAGIATALSLIQLWASPGWPAAIPMMAVVAALGAAQLATILATPIPKYARGTDYHKGGPAIVGDGGVPEIVTFGNKAWVTPDVPTLIDLPVGASVIPNIIGPDDLGLNVVMPVKPTGASTQPKTYSDAKVIERLDRLTDIARGLVKLRRKSEIDAQMALYLNRRL